MNDIFNDKNTEISDCFCDNTVFGDAFGQVSTPSISSYYIPDEDIPENVSDRICKLSRCAAVDLNYELAQAIAMKIIDPYVDRERFSRSSIYKIFGEELCSRHFKAIHEAEYITSDALSANDESTFSISRLKAILDGINDYSVSPDRAVGFMRIARELSNRFRPLSDDVECNDCELLCFTIICLMCYRGEDIYSFAYEKLYSLIKHPSFFIMDIDAYSVLSVALNITLTAKKKLTDNANVFTRLWIVFTALNEAILGFECDPEEETLLRASQLEYEDDDEEFTDEDDTDPLNDEFTDDEINGFFVDEL